MEENIPWQRSAVYTANKLINKCIFIAQLEII